jgi:MFS family permease
MTPARDEQSAWLFVWVGVIAMGIGRFAFTPLLPLMLRDGTIDAPTGAEWAAANYGGYLIGALTAVRFSDRPRAGLMLALVGVAATTLCCAWVGTVAAPLAGLALRAAAGVFSAWTLVCASSWCLGELAKRQSVKLGAWIYSGVGLGIFAAGLLAWLGGGQQARALWAELGLLAAIGTVLIALRLRGVDAPSARPQTAASSDADVSPGQSTRNEYQGLVFCYGTFGFGYIVQATFLPAMARQQVSDPLIFGLTWPLFGAAAALSVVVAARYLSGWPRRRVWATAQGVMALGTAMPLITQSLWALAVSAVLVGGTFMVATMAGLQLARELRPANPMRLLARMTVAFALGQIAGPLLIRMLGAQRWAGMDALTLTNALATVLLCATALWLWRGNRAFAG